MKGSSGNPDMSDDSVADAEFADLINTEYELPLSEALRAAFISPIAEDQADEHISMAIAAMAPGSIPSAPAPRRRRAGRRGMAFAGLFSGLAAKLLTGAVALAAVGGTVATATGVGVDDIAKAIGIRDEESAVVDEAPTTTSFATQVPGSVVVPGGAEDNGPDLEGVVDRDGGTDDDHWPGNGEDGVVFPPTPDPEGPDDGGSDDGGSDDGDPDDGGSGDDDGRDDYPPPVHDPSP